MRDEGDSKLQEFILELAEYVSVSERALGNLRLSKGEALQLLSLFSEWMSSVRKASEQLGLAQIAQIAGLGEEIALKGAAFRSLSQLRRCVDALWDALTTIKYVLVHSNRETDQERKILIRRLEYTLEKIERVGGPSPVTTTERSSSCLLPSLHATPTPQRRS